MGEIFPEQRLLKKSAVTVWLVEMTSVTQCQVQSYSFSYIISPFKSSQASLMSQFYISMATANELVQFKATCTMAIPQKTPTTISAHIIQHTHDLNHSTVKSQTTVLGD